MTIQSRRCKSRFNGEGYPQCTLDVTRPHDQHSASKDGTVYVWETKDAYRAETAGVPDSRPVIYADPWTKIVLRERISEGYGFGDYIVTGIEREQLQALADWLLTLPEETYAPLRTIHQKLERLLAPERTNR